VLRYDDGSRDLVIAFKHRDRTDAAPAYGAWMARAGGDLLEAADLLVPVPLHRLRLIQRRFNQSALLAHALADRSGVTCAPDALIRTRPTPSQGRLSRSARARNVQGAFRVRRREEVNGRRILLVDDVLTTGATASACATTLLRAGAQAVDVLTLARVVRG
jgi:ComF family protein